MPKHHLHEQLCAQECRHMFSSYGLKISLGAEPLWTLNFFAKRTLKYYSLVSEH